MQNGYDWRSLVEKADIHPSRTRFSRGAILTSSSILLVIVTLIFWPILQFKVSPANAGDSTPPPLAPGTSTPTPITATPTLTATPPPTLNAAPAEVEQVEHELISSTQALVSPAKELATPLQTGLIVLSLYEAGYSHLFAYQALETPYTRLTSGPWDDTNPALSPDGRRLAFTSNRSGPWDIYLLDLQTGEVTRLTDTPYFESSPTWSPDGNLIAYESYQEDSEILIRSVFDDQTLINLTEHPAADYHPAWSPQGRQLAFVSNRSGDPEIWLADFDKFDEERFTNLSQTSELDESHPTWSPTGTRLAWAVDQQATHSIYTWDDQTGPAYVSSGDWPAWSPDGSLLLTSLEDANQTLLTAYNSADGGLELPPIILPGQLTGITWMEGALPSPLPEHLQLIGTEVHELAWLAPDRGEAEKPEGQETLTYLTGIQAPFPQLHDSADDAFFALREEVSSAAGWDFLGTLENAFVPITSPLPPGLDEDWLYTGRAFAFNTLPMNAGWVVVVPEYFGYQIYWRVYIQARFQNGSLGEPMRQVPWNFNARLNGDPLYYEQGGQNAGMIPPGYWIDFTELARAYGWQRLPALPTWQSVFYAGRFNEFVIKTNQSWMEAMLDLYPAERLAKPTPLHPPTLTPTRTPSWPIVSTPGP